MLTAIPGPNDYSWLECPSVVLCESGLIIRPSTRTLYILSSTSLAATGSVLITAAKELRPANPMITPKAAQAIEARFCALGEIQTPQVIPAVQIPFAK